MKIWFDHVANVLLVNGMAVVNPVYDADFVVEEKVNESDPRGHMFLWTRPQDCASYDEFEVPPPSSKPFLFIKLFFLFSNPNPSTFNKPQALTPEP